MSREPVRWTNPSQPQTLQVAVFLLYATAVFSVLSLLRGGILLLPLVAGEVAAGFGVANEKKWGYWLGVAMAFAPFALRFFLYRSIGAALGLGPSVLSLINVMFEVALVALLLHPQSREYQRIWFK